MMLASLLATATAHPGFYRRTHTYLDQDQVMAYDPAAGSYSVLQLIRGSARRSGCQTFNPMPLRRGELPAFRKHAYLGEERLLEGHCPAVSPAPSAAARSSPPSARESTSRSPFDEASRRRSRKWESI